jgi:hypothetical protein
MRKVLQLFLHSAGLCCILASALLAQSTETIAIDNGIVPGSRMQAATRTLGITGGYSPYGFS